jgi:hypothetical protein
MSTNLKKTIQIINRLRLLKTSILQITIGLCSVIQIGGRNYYLVKALAAQIYSMKMIQRNSASVKAFLFNFYTRNKIGKHGQNTTNIKARDRCEYLKVPK